MQATAEFASNSTANIKLSELASNSTANIKLSEHLSFFLVTSKSKNVAAKKICGGVVALKVRRKLTCYSYFAML